MVTPWTTPIDDALQLYAICAYPPKIKNETDDTKRELVKL